MQNARFLLVVVAVLSAAPACHAATSAGARANPAHGESSGAYGAYLAGRFAQSQDDLSYAAAELLAAHRADPADREVLTRAFLACVLDGRSEAIELAAELPDNPAAQLLLADQDAAAGKWDAAERRFRALPREGLTQLVQPILVAWAEQGGGHTDAALATLQPYLEGQRFRSVYAMHAAMIADLGGRDTDAARLYRMAKTEYGGINLRLAQILSSWQSRQGDAAEARETLESVKKGGEALGIAIPALIADRNTRQVASAADGIAETYLALAASLRQQEASDSAQLLLHLALDLRPDFTAARLLMADLLEAGKHPAKALAVLAPVAESDPIYSLVQLRRAGLEQAMGNTEAATHLLEQLARESPASPEPLAQLGDMLRSKSRFGEAADAYDRAIARIGAPGRADWSLFYARGIAYDRDHRWSKAEADFERALQLSPDEPYVLNYLGYSWAEKGENLARARQMIEKAAELRPNDGAVIDSLGWVLLRQGDSAGAVRWLERAVELEPEDSTINGHLGDAYWAVGRKLQAQFQWRRALSLNPEPDDAVKLQAKLREATAAAGPTAAAVRQMQ